MYYGFYMSTITLKDIPPSVHSALKLRAKRHGRSLNKEALVCLAMAVAPNTVDVHGMLQELRAHRATLPGRLDDDLIQTANEGRP